MAKTVLTLNISVNESPTIDEISTLFSLMNKDEDFVDSGMKNKVETIIKSNVGTTNIILHMLFENGKRVAYSLISREKTCWEVLLFNSSTDFVNKRYCMLLASFIKENYKISVRSVLTFSAFTYC